MTRRHPRVSIKMDASKGMTKKSFQKECDINQIMLRFQKQGTIDHYAKHAPTYGDVPPIDYQDALNTVLLADNLFADLPSSIRAKFHNDPSEFLSFVQDPANQQEAYDLGLAETAPLSTQEPSGSITPEPPPVPHTPTATTEPTATAE